MTPRSLAQYFRSFLVKLSMIEAQLGQIGGSGKFRLRTSGCVAKPHPQIGRGIVLCGPHRTQRRQGPCGHDRRCNFHFLTHCPLSLTNANDTRQDPPAWVPAIETHTTEAVTDKSELHLVRVVETGIINVSYSHPSSWRKLNSIGGHSAGSGGARERGEAPENI